MYCSFSFTRISLKTVLLLQCNLNLLSGGDPTGSGLGGESVYGADFADEFHQRLKFNRRGLVAMANKGTPNSNGSQFFITLGEAPELQKKNTIFGKVTVYFVKSYRYFNCMYYEK